MAETRTHWKKMTNTKYLGAWDLGDKDMIVRITEVRQEMVKDNKGKDNKDVEILSSVVIEVKDEPVISDMLPLANSQTKDNKRPTISAKLTNVGENPAIELLVNGEAVEAVYENGYVTYTPAADLADGRVTVTLTVADDAITAITVDSSSETPGFGTRCAEDEAFLAQFIGKVGPFEGVDVVAGATVTSNAVVEALNSLFAK